VLIDRHDPPMIDTSNCRLMKLSMDDDSSKCANTILASSTPLITMSEHGGRTPLVNILVVMVVASTRKNGGLGPFTSLVAHFA